MMMMMRNEFGKAPWLSKSLTLGTALAAALMLSTGTSEAAPSVDYSLYSLVSTSTTDPDGNPFVYGPTTTDNAASEAEYVEPTDNEFVANETNVNGLGFFGTNDWEFNPGNGKEDLDPAALTGTWEIQSPNFEEFDYMITFKDGANTSLISFLFNEDYSSGGWNSPFIDPPYDVNNAKQVSHFSIFRRTAGGTITEIPVPAALVLFGFGLVAVGAAHRWKVV